MSDPTQKDPSTLPENPAETLPENLPENDHGLEAIKQEITQLKKDNEALQTKKADFEKTKATLSKEIADQKAKEIADEALRIENKKKEILELIKQTKTELEALKGTVEITSETAELDQLEKDVTAIQVTTPEDKNRFRKQRDGVTSKEEWKTNT